MIRKLPFIFLLLCLGSCGVSKKTASPFHKDPIKITVAASSNVPAETTAIEADKALEKPRGIADEVIHTALLFSGVPYRFGGHTKNGMDCSGLLFTSFKEHDINLPRISHEMADEGKRIKIKEVTKGDLLFFKTGGGKINHVGLVVAVEGDDIKFIHSTTSRGVIVSSLREGYWNYAFVKATRIL
ncbi:C40 family peptidase [Arenibacter sp. GZD96]|uniref:C40 family peptidase n=1 Tax=Aurantibrevibacter litoralis TaxID=3106030 RepID=UPI002AFFFEBA|nr:C40 family peptidase [Arenibacter sp. GZD-96]MEA1787688.1 C40 family peptidase [Arenibacter sp. GZD-96]